ncbi:hypothetical protein D3C81_2040580 [compost metagenome]
MLAAGKHYATACLEHHARGFQTHATGAADDQKFLAFEKIVHYRLRESRFRKRAPKQLSTWCSQVVYLDEAGDLAFKDFEGWHHADGFRKVGVVD